MNDRRLNHAGIIARIKRQARKSQKGYTLVEAIIAIAILGSALAMILGQYGIALKTEMVSKSLLEQSLVINSVADELNLSLQENTAQSLPQKVATVLLKYPDYQLSEITETETDHLYVIEIIHQGVENKKSFFFKVLWRPDETVGA